jgi:hypothetical protein
MIQERMARENAKDGFSEPKSALAGLQRSEAKRLKKILALAEDAGRLPCLSQ